MDFVKNSSVFSAPKKKKKNRGKIECDQLL